MESSRRCEHRRSRDRSRSRSSRRRRSRSFSPSKVFFERMFKEFSRISSRKRSRVDHRDLSSSSSDYRSASPQTDMGRRPSSRSCDRAGLSVGPDQTHAGKPGAVFRDDDPRSADDRNGDSNPVTLGAPRAQVVSDEQQGRESPAFKGFEQPTGGVNPESQLPPKMREILGENPSTTKSTEVKLHSSLTDRWSIWLKEGIPYAEFTEVKDRYPPPINLEMITPPLLNPELAESLSPFNKKRDDHYMTFQRQVSTALTATGTALTVLMNRAADDEPLFSPLWDVGRSLVALHCDISRFRKKTICDALPGPLRSVSSKAVPSKFLFGNDLRSLVRDQQGISSFAKDLLPPKPLATPSQRQPLPSTSAI
uniref:Uncharacterized protein n=1 Tax=Lygus hesperus TaxID=30085 RepID=A0A0A9WGV2_LYGHE